MKEKEIRYQALKALKPSGRKPGDWGKGANHMNTNLTDADVLEIVRLHQDGLTQASIARQYDLTTGSVSNIVNGKTWSEVTGIDPRCRRVSPILQARILNDSKKTTPDGTRMYFAKDLARRYTLGLRTVQNILLGRY